MKQFQLSLNVMFNLKEMYECEHVKLSSLPDIQQLVNLKVT